MKVHKVTAYPETMERDAVYIKAIGENQFELVVTDTSGTGMRYLSAPVTQPDVTADVFMLMGA